MIYDCFHFFNELEMLDIRLNIMNDYVDKFVLVEANKTHFGTDKDFLFEKNKHKYKKFLDKIIHIKLSDVPDINISEKDKYGNKWLIENYIRDGIIKGLQQAKPEDLLIISDLDEIINPEILKQCSSGIYTPELLMFYYKFNCLNITEPIWTNAKICRYQDLINPNQDFNLEGPYRYTKKGLPTYIRFCNGKRIKNGGWHFSYLLSEEQIVTKIKALCEQSNNNPRTFEYLNEKIKKNQDIFNRDYKYKIVNPESVLPKYILSNKEKYKNYIVDGIHLDYRFYTYTNKIRKLLRKIFYIHINKTFFKIIICGIKITKKLDL